MTPDEERQLAEDIFHGRVFTDRHVRPAEVPMVFMLLGMADEKLIKDMMEYCGERGMIYEYLSNAGPVSCNGHPTFLSHRLLTTEEADRVLGMARKMSEVVKAVKA